MRHLPTAWLSRGRLACVWAVMACAVLTGCAKDRLLFTPPTERPVTTVDRHLPDGLLTLAYHDIEDQNPSPAHLSVRTDRLVEQLTWLRLNGYQPVSVDQVLAARGGGKALPPRSVLLSFDDGYSSFYTRVLPILKAYNWPFVFSPVGSWLDTSADQPVNFGGTMTNRERFLTWDQVREMAASPLVEVGAHSDSLHHGVLANPQGNAQPAAAMLQYDPATGLYETQAAFELRLRNDIKAVTDKVRQATGKQPRVWVWPYGAASGKALEIVREHGYELTLTLEDGLGTFDGPTMAAPRLLLSADPKTRHFAASVVDVKTTPMMRVAHVDLDYVYDQDAAQMERNLGQLVQRIADLRITTVFLQAYADPKGDGLVHELYFPNRWLPMRADLFNRAAWQLRTRAGVEVYAWMPVLSYALDPALPRVKRAGGAAGHDVDPEQYQRLSPFDPRVRQRIGDLYEDLARHAAFHGILFHDDAVLTDFEDAGPQALAAYQAAGLPGSIEALRSDPQTMQRWTRFKSRALIDFTHELTRRVREVRGAPVATARNLFALPILQPQSEAWFAQNLDDFLAAYDWTAPMAMPLMEGVQPVQANAWLDSLVDAVARRPGALDRTVFELQAKDWSLPGDPAVDSATLAGWMRRLQLRGARNFGHYPDNFLRDEPRLEVIRPALSNAWFPHHD